MLKTDDIKCEYSENGYNSSIILWRNGIGMKIYEFMYKYHEYLIHILLRFDHYLEFIIKNADYIQEIFPKKVLDYNTYCKERDNLPENASIIAFPRNPKPHSCKEKWISEHWR